MLGCFVSLTGGRMLGVAIRIPYVPACASPHAPVVFLLLSIQHLPHLVDASWSLCFLCILPDCCDKVHKLLINVSSTSHALDLVFTTCLGILAGKKTRNVYHLDSARIKPTCPLKWLCVISENIFWEAL